MSRSTGVPLPPAVIRNPLCGFYWENASLQSREHAASNQRAARSACTFVWLITQCNLVVHTHDAHGNAHTQRVITTFTQSELICTAADPLQKNPEKHRHTNTSTVAAHFNTKLLVWLIRRPVQLACGSSFGSTLYVCVCVCVCVYVCVISSLRC